MHMYVYIYIYTYIYIYIHTPYLEFISSFIAWKLARAQEAASLALVHITMYMYIYIYIYTYICNSMFPIYIYI